jgi:hypothetical protein
VAIDASGKWWVGDLPGDLDDYLRAYTEDRYPVTEFRLSKCQCGSVIFGISADTEEGVARRTCVNCKNKHHICDSEEFWAEASPKSWKCTVCGSKHANVGVGFSMYDDDSTGVKWLYLGERCVKCGTLGCFAEWKVALSDALHLLEKA